MDVLKSSSKIWTKNKIPSSHTAEN